MRQVVRSVARHQRVEIVAADPALHLGNFSPISAASRPPRSSMSRNNASPLSDEFTRARSRGTSPKCSRVPSASAASIEVRVVAHGAVSERTAAAGIVAGHAADGGARRGGDVDRKPQPVLLSWRLRSSSTMPGSTTQLRFSTSSERMRFRCLEKSTTMPSLTVWPHCEVPPPRGGVTTSALIPGDGERPQRLVHGPGHHHPKGHDLVERGVGRIAAAVEGVEEHVAGNLAGKPVFERH